MILVMPWQTGTKNVRTACDPHKLLAIHPEVIGDAFQCWLTLNRPAAYHLARRAPKKCRRRIRGTEGLRLLPPRPIVVITRSGPDFRVSRTALPDSMSSARRYFIGGAVSKLLFLQLPGAVSIAHSLLAIK